MRRTYARISAVVLLSALAAACGPATFSAAWEDANRNLAREWAQNPGGQLGAGIDAALAGLAVQQATPPRRR